MTPTDNQGSHHRNRSVSRPNYTQDLRTSTLMILTVTRVAPAHADEEAPELDPRIIPPCWALSPLDWHAHAIDSWADHPLGMWIARCGYRLSGGTPLYDVPQGQRCANCVKWSRTNEPSEQPSSSWA
jgi:hypothetical protein